MGGRNLLGLLAAIQFGFGIPGPARGEVMSLCTADGPIEVPLGSTAPVRDDRRDRACAHACNLRERRRGG